MQEITFNPKTKKDVVNVLKSLVDTDTRVKIEFGNPVTGECANQVYKNVGYIKSGKNSTHTILKLVNNKRSMSGIPIDDSRIIKISYSNLSVGGSIYRHKNFNKINKVIE